MEDFVINLLKKFGVTKFHLDYLVDLGDDEEYFPIVCDTIEIIDSKVCLYDSSNENEDRSIDYEDIHFFNDLTEAQKEETIFYINKTYFK